MTIENGWVITGEDGRIYDFTYSRIRKHAIRRYTKLWKNESWKYYYRKGVRCVKAKMTITLLDNNENGAI